MDIDMQTDISTFDMPSEWNDWGWVKNREEKILDLSSASVCNRTMNCMVPPHINCVYR